MDIKDEIDKAEREINAIEQEINAIEQRKYLSEYITTIIIFCMMFGLMLVACIARLFGIEIFKSDNEIIINSIILQMIIKFALKVFEGVFILKILTRKTFSFCTIATILYSLFAFFIIPPFIQPYADMILAITLAFSMRKNKKQVAKETVIFFVIVFSYGIMFAIARFMLSSEILFDYNAQINGAIDYKLLFVNMYLFLKFKEARKNVKKI